MEPVTTLTATAIATLVATKAFEKTGEKIGEAVTGLIPKFLAALRRKHAETADAIASVAQQPQLAEQQPEIYSPFALAAKVDSIGQEDPEVLRVAREIQTAIQAQPGAIVNLTQLAEKIGVVNQGTVVNQTNHLSF
jgi:hypothetical protein